jgi:hypothetical protein
MIFIQRRYASKFLINHIESSETNKLHDELDGMNYFLILQWPLSTHKYDRNAGSVTGDRQLLVYK